MEQEGGADLIARDQSVSFRLSFYHKADQWQADAWGPAALLRIQWAKEQRGSGPVQLSARIRSRSRSRYAQKPPIDCGRYAMSAQMQSCDCSVRGWLASGRVSQIQSVSYLWDCTHRARSWRLRNLTTCAVDVFLYRILDLRRVVHRLGKAVMAVNCTACEQAVRMLGLSESQMVADLVAQAEDQSSW